jgi:hypothetical protein
VLIIGGINLRAPNAVVAVAAASQLSVATAEVFRLNNMAFLMAFAN